MSTIAKGTYRLDCGCDPDHRLDLQIFKGFFYHCTKAVDQIYGDWLGFSSIFTSCLVSVILWRVVRRAMKTSIYNWSRSFTVNCCPPASNYQLSHMRSGPYSTSNLRGGRRVCYHCTTMVSCDWLGLHCCIYHLVYTGPSVPYVQLMDVTMTNSEEFMSCFVPKAKGFLEKNKVRAGVVFSTDVKKIRGKWEPPFLIVHQYKNGEHLQSTHANGSGELYFTILCPFSYSYILHLFTVFGSFIADFKLDRGPAYMIN